MAVVDIKMDNVVQEPDGKISLYVVLSADNGESKEVCVQGKDAEELSAIIEKKAKDFQEDVSKRVATVGQLKAELESSFLKIAAKINKPEVSDVEENKN